MAVAFSLFEKARVVWNCVNENGGGEREKEISQFIKFNFIFNEMLLPDEK